MASSTPPNTEPRQYQVMPGQDHFGQPGLRKRFAWLVTRRDGAEPLIKVTSLLKCTCGWSTVFGKALPCRHVRAILDYTKRNT